MANKAFVECLQDVYMGELAGEGIFEALLPTAESARERYILGSLLQFETEGKARLRPLLMRFDLPIVDTAAEHEAATAAAQLGGLAWTERFSAMREAVASSYLPRYEELATLVSAEEDPEAARIASFMGEHERALLALADNIIAGTEDPAAPVAALLQFPLPTPGR